MTKLLTALFAAVFISAPAMAGVVYNWVNISPTDNGFDHQGQVIISNEVYLSGATAVSNFFPDAGTPSGLPSCPNTIAAGGIEFFEFGPAIAGSGLTYYGDGLDRAFDNYCDPTTSTPPDQFLLSFTAVGDHLEGSIFIYSMNDEIDLGGTDVWNIFDIGSDNNGSYGGCAYFHTCQGATGRWIIDPSTIPVPTPPGLTFLLFGLVGVALLKKHPVRYKHGHS